MNPKTAELREKAAGLFKAANDYLAEIGKDDYLELGDEEKAKFDGLLADAEKADHEYEVQAGAEGKVEGVRERMSFYHEKATGRRVSFVELPNQMAERPKSWGEQYTESDEYQRLVKSGALTSDRKFETAGVEVKAATDLIDTVSGGPAAALVRPEYRPGILGLPERPLVVRDLFAQGTIGTETLIYARQTARDSGVAAVAQATAVDGTGLTGGVKPQSSIAFEEETATVKNIATWFAATRQSLADAGVLRSLIDNQGRLMLDRYVDDQLLNGDGNGPNLEGLLDAGVGIQTLDLTGEDNLDGVRTSRRLVRQGVSRASADGIVLNPEDSEEFDLLKDLNGSYRGGNPIGNFTFDQPIWGLRRVESEAVAAGTAVVGAFRFGATVLQRSPVQIFTTDSHADFFIRNLIVLLFEERLAFPIWWPSAFVEVTLASWAEPT